ncbi:hypothetical protein LINGRAHAP2_LOCUS2701 [Linum grandiflorum]
MNVMKLTGLAINMRGSPLPSVMLAVGSVTTTLHAITKKRKSLATRASTQGRAPTRQRRRHQKKLRRKEKREHRPLNGEITLIEKLQTPSNPSGSTRSREPSKAL